MASSYDRPDTPPRPVHPALRRAGLALALLAGYGLLAVKVAAFLPG